MPPIPPTNLQEYQKKRLMKIAFRKSLILKAAILVVLGLLRPKTVALKKKSGSQLPHLRCGFP